MEHTEEETLEEKKLVERITNRILSSSYIQALRSKILGDQKIAIFVDGPNFLRKIGNRQVKLEEIEDNIQDLGSVVLKKVILNEFAGEGLIQAIINSGYEPLVSPHDIYITLAVEVMKVIGTSRKPNVIVIASRHARATPILHKIKEKGIATIVIGFDPGFSIALQKAADTIITIE